MSKRRRTPLEKAVDQELIQKGRNIQQDFEESEAIHVSAKRKDSKLISIRLPMDMLRKLRQRAQKRGDIGYQQLIKLYLAQCLDKEECGVDADSFYTFLKAYMEKLTNRTDEVYFWCSTQTSPKDIAKLDVGGHYPNWRFSLCERVEEAHDVGSLNLELRQRGSVRYLEET
jgi:predicted DNA binding CopG/RHH family protein